MLRVRKADPLLPTEPAALEAWWALDQVPGKEISPGDHRSFLGLRYKEAVGTSWMMLPMVSDHHKQLTHSNEPLAQLMGIGFAMPQREGQPFPPHGQYWCDHPGLRSGTSQGQPSWSIMQRGRRSRAGNRAAPTHA